MIKTRKFDTHNGRDVIEATLSSEMASIAILNYGCVVRDWRVCTKTGTIPVVLGFDDFAAYPAHSPSFGIIAGRVANRIACGRFPLNGTDYQLPINNGVNHLHGGAVGFGRRIWDMEIVQNTLRLTYHSPDGEEGYPANVNFQVSFTLEGTTLTCEMSAKSDAPTPINLAQHSYYNLNGGGDIRDHLVKIAANSYTPTDSTQIPTGVIAPVHGTRFDFTTPISCAQSDPEKLGVDMNLVLDKHTGPAATVTAKSGLTLKLWTSEPGLQVFNAPEMDIPVRGIQGRKYGPFGGLCLEAQHFPDSVNRPEWPSIIYTPERPYHQKLVVDIAP